LYTLALDFQSITVDSLSAALLKSVKQQEVGEKVYGKIV